MGTAHVEMRAGQWVVLDTKSVSRQKQSLPCYDSYQHQTTPAHAINNFYGIERQRPQSAAKGPGPAFVSSRTNVAMRSWRQFGQRFFAAIFQANDNFVYVWATAACGALNADKYRVEIRMNQMVPAKKVRLHGHMNYFAHKLYDSRSMGLATCTPARSSTWRAPSTSHPRSESCSITQHVSELAWCVSRI